MVLSGSGTEFTTAELLTSGSFLKRFTRTLRPRLAVPRTPPPGIASPDVVEIGIRQEVATGRVR